LSSVSRGETTGIILRLSDEIGITPVLVGRFILEAYLRQLQQEFQELDDKAEDSESEKCLYAYNLNNFI